MLDSSVLGDAVAAAAAAAATANKHPVSTHTLHNPQLQIKACKRGTGDSSRKAKAFTITLKVPSGKWYRSLEKCVHFI